MQVEENMIEMTETKPKKILLVEDSQQDTILIQKTVKEVFPDAVLVPVKSLGEAYKEYKNHNFNLVLLDLNLPDGFGSATVTEVRRFNKSVPIVVLTGLGSNMTLYEALKNGANHFALKSQLLDDDFKNILEQHTT